MVTLTMFAPGFAAKTSALALPSPPIWSRLIATLPRPVPATSAPLRRPSPPRWSPPIVTAPRLPVVASKPLNANTPPSAPPLKVPAPPSIEPPTVSEAMAGAST